MRKYSTLLAGGMIIAAMLACNLPTNQPNDVAATAVVQTETALALTAQVQVPPSSTPTYTPVPFPSPPPATLGPAATATSNCNSAHFITDVTYPDNTVVAAGDTFTKTWRLQNSGTCSWTTSYAVVFTSGESMGGPSVQALTGNVNPGQTVDISVGLTAPSTNGTHIGHWALRNAAGVVFGTFYVQIIVGSGGSSGGAFAVTHVGFTVTGSCGNFHIAVSITTNGAGTVNYHRVWSDGGTDSTPGTFVYSVAGTQSVTYDSSTSGTGWMDIYVDSPNHQQFGRATYPCP